MAFLICYTLSPGGHAGKKAIYLDQEFYELIFRHRLTDGGPYSILREMASLRYKSPLMAVSDGQLEALYQELADFEAAGLTHRQIAAFREICATAKASGCTLTISGDMYPEL